MKIEHYAKTSNKGQQTHLHGIAKVFGDANRATLWAALYKKCSEIQNIPRLRRGRKNTQLQVQRNKQYGAEIDNDLAVSQWSEVSARRFTIYMDCAISDYQEINYNWRIPYRTITHRTDGRKTKTLLEDIQQEQESKPNMKQKGGNKHNPEKAQTTHKKQKPPTGKHITTDTR